MHCIEIVNGMTSPVLAGPFPWLPVAGMRFLPRLSSTALESFPFEGFMHILHCATYQVVSRNQNKALTESFVKVALSTNQVVSRNRIKH